MTDPYKGREQTKAKHFILREYLYALAFKILSFRSEISYVDGFSGPWEQKASDFSDTSFGIALEVLRNVQDWYLREKGESKTIRCIFVEKKKSQHALLREAVAPANRPRDCFHVKTICSEFETSVPEILKFVGNSFALTFIDPTGWTGYGLDRVGPLLRHAPGEVLVNFMYDFTNRFAASTDEKIVASYDPILGGPGWKTQLHPHMPLGPAVVRRFKDELKNVAGFEWVASTDIKKATKDRIHFTLVYGTRNYSGLKEFRKVGWKALERYERDRISARIDQIEERSGTPDMFRDLEMPQENIARTDIEEALATLKDRIWGYLKSRTSGCSFKDLSAHMMEALAVRETDVKSVCVELARDGLIPATWKARGSRFNKPDLTDIIRLADQF